MSGNDLGSGAVDARTVDDRVNVRASLWDPLNAWPAGRRWLWMFLAILACWSQGPEFIESLRPPPDRGIDFFQDWASARNLLHGLPIYTSHDVSVQTHFGVQATQVNHSFNVHPPTSVLVAVPFALLSYPDATLVWNVLSLLFFGATIWRIARALGIPLRGWSVFPFVALVLVSGPTRQQVMQGQFNFLLLFMLTELWLADRSERQVLAGALLGAATALKLFPGLLFLYFAVRCRWKVVAAGLTTCALLTLLTALALGPDTFSDYYSRALPSITQYPWRNISIWGFWAKLFRPTHSLFHVEGLWQSPGTARLASVVCCVLIVAVATWVARLSRSRVQQDYAFAITSVAMLLVCPVCWEHYLVLLTPALFVMWTRLRATDLDRAVFFLLLVASWIPMERICDMIISHGDATFVHGLTLLSLQSYALVGLFLFGVREWHRAGQQAKRQVAWCARGNDA